MHSSADIQSSNQVSTCVVNTRPYGREGYQDFCKTLAARSHYKWDAKEYDGMIGKQSCPDGRKLRGQDSNIIGPPSLKDVNDNFISRFAELREEDQGNLQNKNNAEWDSKVTDKFNFDSTLLGIVAAVCSAVFDRSSSSQRIISHK
jgi:hypothetical protein